MLDGPGREDRVRLRAGGTRIDRGVAVRGDDAGGRGSYLHVVQEFVRDSRRGVQLEHGVPEGMVRHWCP